MSNFDWPGDEPAGYTPPEREVHQELRVVGPPGCGKTSYVARQVKEVAIPKYGSGRVVLCSLTKAAAAEIVGRDTGVPPENVGTLHAHAFRALERPNLAETAENLKAWNEWCGVAAYRMDPSRVAADEVHEDAGATASYEGGDLLAQAGVLRQRMTPEAMWPQHLAAFMAKWREFKDGRDLVDFTDMIEKCVEEVEFHPANPEVIMADEAQDMSTLEMKLLRKWGAHATSLVLVGDPDQSLYTWRGADPHSVFGTDPEGVIVRSQGFRVPEAVRAWAHDWIAQIPDRLPVDYLPRHEDPSDLGSPVAIGSLESRPYTWKAPDGLVDEAISEAYGSSPRTVMILTSCSYMLAPIISRLRSLGVPFHNPYRRKAYSWNPLAGATRGGREHRVLSYLRPQPTAWGDDARLWTWDEVERWLDPIKSQGNLVRGAKSLVKSKVAPDRFGESRAQDQAPYADVMRLLADDEARQRVFEGDVDWWHERLNARDHDSQAYPIKVLREHGAAAIRQEPRIIVGTIHSVKGGEAEVVFVCPDLSAAGYWDGYKAGVETEPYASIIRLFYVAATRARQDLRLCASGDTTTVQFA